MKSCSAPIFKVNRNLVKLKQRNSILSFWDEVQYPFINEATLFAFLLSFLLKYVITSQAFVPVFSRFIPEFFFFVAPLSFIVNIYNWEEIVFLLLAWRLFLFPACLLSVIGLWNGNIQSCLWVSHLHSISVGILMMFFFQSELHKVSVFILFSFQILFILLHVACGSCWLHHSCVHAFTSPHPSCSVTMYKKWPQLP